MRLGAASTRAEKTGATSYVLNGSKAFITSGANADGAIVFAVTDPDGRQEGYQCLHRAHRQSRVTRPAAPESENGAARVGHGIAGLPARLRWFRPDHLNRRAKARVTVSR